MSLHTLAAAAAHESEVKRSRFLARALPVATPEEALQALPAISVADATHNCWAYRVGAEYRSSDDGEPAGTAGRPILAAIDGQGIDQVVVVVTRWYGGIKLGAGGLVRAYGGAAAECLRRGERVPLVELAGIALHLPFDDLGTVHAAMAAHSAVKSAENYGIDGVDILLHLPADRVQALKVQLRDATRNRVRFDEEG